jgi:hypothetical protein
MITIIDGPKKSGKTTMANSLRNQHIGAGGAFTPDRSKSWKPHGSLLIDEDQDGEPRHLLEKLLHGDALPEDGTPVPADKLNWKVEPTVVVVGKKQEKLLDEFEKLVPGFKAKVGPVKRLQLTSD